MGSPFQNQQSPFGQQPQQQPQGSPFGQQPQQQPQGSPFGQQPAQQTPQGQPQGSPFGQPQPGAQPQQQPFGQSAQQHAPFGQQPQQQAPQGYPQPVNQPQTTAPGGDPFGAMPAAPEGAGGLGKSDAEANSVIIMRVNSVEHGVPSKFPDQKTQQPKTQTRLHCDVQVVTGPQAGAVFMDQWISWTVVAQQFAPCAGDGVPYLVQLGVEQRGGGQAVVAAEVTDPQMRAYAATLLGG